MPFPKPNESLANTDIILLEAIGGGGYGQVYRAYSSLPGYRSLLVKIFDLRNIGSDVKKQVQRSWEAECKVHEYACNVKWEYVRWLFSSGGEADYLWIVTRWAPSLPLQLKDYPLTQFLGVIISPHLLVKIAQQLMHRLSQLHERNIIHGDISPGNILYSYAVEDLFLIDFGLSLNAREDTGSIIPDRPCKPKGTPRYRSINSLEGHRRTYRDDLESATYVLFALTLGVKATWFLDEKYLPIEKELKFKKDLCNQPYIKQILPLIALRDYASQLEYGEMPDYHYCHQQVTRLNWPYTPESSG